MRAAVGDWLHMDGPAEGQPQRAGQIVEVRGACGGPPYLVRFRDGRTSLVIPGPGAVIERSGLDEPAPTTPVIFRVTGRQRRALVSGAVVILGATAVLAGLAAAVPTGRL